MADLHDDAREMPPGYSDAPNRRVTGANAVDYVYRDVGVGEPPLVLLQHFRGNLDNWDPALIDALGPSTESRHLRQRRRRWDDGHDAQHGPGDGPRRHRRS
jgi:hypothetical protein